MTEPLEGAEQRWMRGSEVIGPFSQNVTGLRTEGDDLIVTLADGTVTVLPLAWLDAASATVSQSVRSAGGMRKPNDE